MKCFSSVIENRIIILWKLCCCQLLHIGVPGNNSKWCGNSCAECGDINSFADAFSEGIENRNLMKKWANKQESMLINIFIIGAVTNKLLEAYIKLVMKKILL